MLMNLRDQIFKIIKEQIFFEDNLSGNKEIDNPAERKKVDELINKGELPKNEIYKLAVGDPTHNVFGRIARNYGFDGKPLMFLDAMIDARKRGIPIEDIIAEAKKQYNDMTSKKININDAVKNVRNMSLEPKPEENEEESNDVSYFDLVSHSDWQHIYRWATFYRDKLLVDALNRQTTNLHGKELDDDEIILNIIDYINIDNPNSQWSGLMHVYSPGKYFAFLFNIDVLSFGAQRWEVFQPPINTRSVYNIEYKLEKGEKLFHLERTQPFILFYKELKEKEIIRKNGNKEITYENIKDLVKEKDYFKAYLVLMREGEAKGVFGQEADRNQKTKISADYMVNTYAHSSKYTASFTELIHKKDNKETKGEVNSTSSVPMRPNDEWIQNMNPNQHGRKLGGPNYGKHEEED